MGDVTNEQKFFAFLAYCTIFVLIPLFVKKDDEFVHWHVKQGLVMLIAAVIIWIIIMLPVLGMIFGGLLGFILFAYWILAVVHVLQGKQWELPLIGKYAEKFNV